MLGIALTPRQTSSRLGARIVAGWIAVRAWLFALAAQQEPPPAIPAIFLTMWHRFPTCLALPHSMHCASSSWPLGI